MAGQYQQLLSTGGKRNGASNFGAASGGKGDFRENDEERKSN
jgi:hypothetical protein